jgi:hypothetical protein
MGAPRDLDGFVEIGALKQVEADDLLLRPGERAVCHDDAGVPHRTVMAPPGGSSSPPNRRTPRPSISATQGPAGSIRGELPAADRRAGADGDRIPDPAFILQYRTPGRTRTDAVAASAACGPTANGTRAEGTPEAEPQAPQRGGDLTRGTSVPRCPEALAPRSHLYI